MTESKTPLLDTVTLPADIRRLRPDQLRQLADELRQETISAVSVTGGHLGAGLGVVELTVALHYVFDTPRDRLIWDVGHQAYPHKIVTGRRGRIRTLRQEGGLSGFTRRSESDYDPFGAAHSSTSVSAARPGRRERGARGAEEWAGGRGGGGTLLDEWGFYYVGRVDGHNIDHLLRVLKTARDSKLDKPILVHVVTQKGKGYPPAENSADKYHGVVKFDVITGKQAKAVANAPNYQSVFAKALIA